MRSFLKPLIIASILAGLLTSGVYFWLQARAPVAAKDKISTLEEMETDGIPMFTAPNIFGEVFDLASTRGKVTIVHFWASWCGPCVDEIPDLIKLAREQKEKVALVALSVDDEKAEMDRFLERYFPERTGEVEFIWDEGKRVSQKYSVIRLPESFIARPDHRLARKIIGSIHWNTPQAVSYLDQVFQSGSPPSLGSNKDDTPPPNESEGPATN